MNTTQRAGLLQRWSVIQEELIPGLGQEVEVIIVDPGFKTAGLDLLQLLRKARSTVKLR
jgi:hypothetical protein